jgi:hypothetical protein
MLEEEKKKVNAADAAAETTSASGSGDDEDEDLATADVTDPRESDVLCGIGGAALRHPGNQTYRRLVNLNKALYITCLKTEKLKISWSIVSAIRKQQGRFLERNAKKGSWYDIGDKKAIEKTSQALREGQPKLQQKMIDLGQIPPNQGTNMEHQYDNGIYNPRGAPSSSANSLGSFPDSSAYAMQHPPQGGMTDMPPPPAHKLSSNSEFNASADMMMQRLSLSTMTPNTI